MDNARHMKRLAYASLATVLGGACSGDAVAVPADPMSDASASTGGAAGSGGAIAGNGGVIAGNGGALGGSGGANTGGASGASCGFACPDAHSGPDSGDAKADAPVDAKTDMGPDGAGATDGGCLAGCTKGLGGWCATLGVEWVCSGQGDFTRMRAAGCTELPTGAIRYCCPDVFAQCP
jgi:hypothetical protein